MEGYQMTPAPIQNVSEYQSEARDYPSLTLWAKHAPTLTLVQSSREGREDIEHWPFFSAHRNKKVKI